MTEEEFTEQLSMSQPDVSGLEPGCNEQEVVELQAMLGSYRHQTMLWAERRSASQPSLAHRARAEQRWAALPRWALATVCLVTIAGGVAHLVADRDEVPENTVAATLPVAAPQSAADDLAADNHLLRSIDAELSYHGGSPVDALRLQEEGTADQTGAAEVID